MRLAASNKARRLRRQAFPPPCGQAFFAAEIENCSKKHSLLPAEHSMFVAGKSARPSGRTDQLKQTPVKRRRRGFINLRNLHASKIPDITTCCIHADCARSTQLSARSGHRRKTAYNPYQLGVSLHLNLKI